MKHRKFPGLLLAAFLTFASAATAQQNPDGRLPLGDLGNPLVLLLRDEEVLREIRVSQVQRSGLEALADQLDAIVWPARNQTAEQVNSAWVEATTLAQNGAAKILSVPQRRRVEEIILWIQGTRALLRDDVGEQLQLTPDQRKSIRDDVVATNQQIGELRKRAAGGEPPGPLEEKARDLRLDEQRRVLERLSDDQRISWLKLVGQRVDVTKLGQVSFRAPGLVADSGDWLNGKASLDHRERRVTVVHFFANGCINCQRNYAHYRLWDDMFRNQGVVIIGIHTPETKAEYDVGLLKRKVAEAGFQFPILVDNEKKNWNAWGNSMWPSVYLVDQQGRIRYWWYGELNWQGAEGEKRMRARIAELLAESRSGNSAVPITPAGGSGASGG